MNYEAGLLLAGRYRLEDVIAVGGMYPVWLMTITAPPCRGTCSAPVMVKRSPCAANTPRATVMTLE